MIGWFYCIEYGTLTLNNFQWTCSCITNRGKDAFELLSQHFSNGLGDYLPELHTLVGAELAKLKDEAIKFTL